MIKINASIFLCCFTLMMSGCDGTRDTEIRNMGYVKDVVLSLYSYQDTNKKLPDSLDDISHKLPPELKDVKVLYIKTGITASDGSIWQVFIRDLKDKNKLYVGYLDKNNKFEWKIIKNDSVLVQKLKNTQ